MEGTLAWFPKTVPAQAVLDGNTDYGVAVVWHVRPRSLDTWRLVHRESLTRLVMVAGSLFVRSEARGVPQAGTIAGVDFSRPLHYQNGRWKRRHFLWTPIHRRHPGRPDGPV